MKIAIYLADQNPHRDRSKGITTLTGVLLTGLSKLEDLSITTITSPSSYSISGKRVQNIQLPFRTDQTFFRMAADHFHPWMLKGKMDADLIHYPKGYLPSVSWMKGRRVITVHDTIVQHYADHYPQFRSSWNYRYWIHLLAFSIRKADMILTSSLTAQSQIQKLCDRYHFSPPEIHIASVASHYEDWQPAEASEKENYVLHFASVEPHKKTLHLLQWWKALEQQGKDLPALRLVGFLSKEALQIFREIKNALLDAYLQKDELAVAIKKSRALLFPSEIEGFGSPALEAYYLGTPVCFVQGTSVDEFLSKATSKGAFSLNHIETFSSALDEILEMKSDEILLAGNILRKNHSTQQYIESVLRCFRKLKSR